MVNKYTEEGMHLLINPKEYTRFGRALKDGEFRHLHKGSYEYIEMWTEQLDRCINGYSVGGKWISGELYSYVNFGNIELLDATGRNKGFELPYLRDVEWEIDYYYHQAFSMRKGLMLMAGRRLAKSVMASWYLTHAMNFYNASVVLGAADDNYIDDHYSKILVHYMNLVDTTEIYQSYINFPNEAGSIILGTRSQNPKTKEWTLKPTGGKLSIVNFKLGFTKSVGKGCKLMVFEEIGMFNNLLRSFEASKYCWTEGTSWYGIPFLIGTGGDMDKGTRDAYELFLSSESNNFLTFQEDGSSIKTAYFIPGYMRFNEFRDDYGYIDHNKAIEYCIDHRAKLLEAKNTKALYEEKQFTPLEWEEVFLKKGSNIFRVDLLQQQITNIVTNPLIQNSIVKGKLKWDNGRVVFEMVPTAEEVPYPVKQGDSEEGCVTIYQFPNEKDDEGRVPKKLYIGGCDPYAQDKGSSLGSIMIFRRFYSAAGQVNNMLVAEFTGRPDKPEDFYEIARMLAVYYNAEILYENNTPGMFGYFNQKIALRYLAKQPLIIDDIVKDSEVKREYGIHMTKEIKIALVGYIQNYLMTEVAEGVTNISHIYSLNLLRELIAFNLDDNFDRVIAFGLCLIKNEEEYKTKVKEVEDTAEKNTLAIFGAKLKAKIGSGNRVYSK